MSSSSNQNSLNTALGKLTINNAYNAKAHGYVDSETVITSTFININGNVVNTAKIISSQYTGINVIVPAQNGDGTPGTATFEISGDDLEYNFTDTTVPTWSITTASSSITVSDILFNFNDNTLTITFSDDTDYPGTVESLYINFYTPPL